MADAAAHGCAMLVCSYCVSSLYAIDGAQHVVFTCQCINQQLLSGALCGSHAMAQEYGCVGYGEVTWVLISC